MHRSICSQYKSQSLWQDTTYQSINFLSSNRSLKSCVQKSVHITMCAAHHAADLGGIVLKTLPPALVTSQSGWDNFYVYEKLQVVRSNNTTDLAEHDSVGQA